MTDNILGIESLHVCYEQGSRWPFSRPEKFCALQDINLELKAGEILAVVGESGSGKTTLARTIAGFLQPDSGELHFASNGEIKVQYIFQDPYGSLNPSMSVEQIILEPTRYTSRQQQPGRLQERLQQIMQQVGLDYDQRFRYPHEFSGGQCQRIAIARALIAEPDILICDEPVSALDVSVRAQVINLLLELNRTRRLSQIFIAHDLWLTRYLSDEVMVLYQGRIMEQGRTRQVFEHPAHPYTRDLLAASPVADPRSRSLPAISQAGRHIASDSGCPYAGRCRYAQPDCSRQRPASIRTKNGTNVACFYPVDD